MTSFSTSLSTSDENANPNVAVSYVQGTFFRKPHVHNFLRWEEISAWVNCADQKTLIPPYFGQKIKIFIIRELARVTQITVWSTYLKKFDENVLSSNFLFNPKVIRDLIAILVVKKSIFSPKMPDDLPKASFFGGNHQSWKKLIPPMFKRDNQPK